MRADIHDGPEQMLQSKAGYIDARPLTTRSTKTSCNARPDHTLGQSRRSDRAPLTSGLPPTDILARIRHVAKVPTPDSEVATDSQRVRSTPKQRTSIPS